VIALAAFGNALVTVPPYIHPLADVRPCTNEPVLFDEMVKVLAFRFIVPEVMVRMFVTVRLVLVVIAGITPKVLLTVRLLNEVAEVPLIVCKAVPLKVTVPPLE